VESEKVSIMDSKIDIVPKMKVKAMRGKTKYSKKKRNKWQKEKKNVENQEVKVAKVAQKDVVEGKNLKKEVEVGKDEEHEFFFKSFSNT
jgi:hypothetical protein